MDISRRGLVGATPLIAGLAATQAFAKAPLEPAKLNANENPYGPSPKAIEALVRAAKADGSRYPSRYAEALTAAIAKNEGVQPANVVLGNGSGELLAAAGLAFGLGGKQIVAADPTFNLLMLYARGIGASVKSIRVLPDFQHDFAAMDVASAQAQTGLVYVCNPNNPTGTLADPDVLRRFCRSVAPRVPVLVDECYNEITEDPAKHSMIDLVREGLPVLITRTFSKVHGLAGLRVGYLLAPEALARKVSDKRMGIMSVAGLAAAQASLEDKAFQAFAKRKIEQGRADVNQMLASLNLPFAESHTNFVFFDAKRPGAELAKALEAKGVLITARTPAFPTWARVSMGKLEDVARFNRAMRELYGA
jgi:histidinol-phosphate aminotransferase